MIKSLVCQAGMSELADETDSKSVTGNRVWVRFPLPAHFHGASCADALFYSTFLATTT